MLARVDDEEYSVLPDAASVVPIRMGDLDVLTRHEIRIIAPMTEDLVTLQFRGMWIDQGGDLLPPESQEENSSNEAQSPSSKQYKMVEILTDIAGSKAINIRKNVGITRRILGGVMGWDFWLGDMFSADHVTIGMQDMCLIHGCIGGQGAPIGLADIFFQRYLYPL